MNDCLRASCKALIVLGAALFGMTAAAAERFSATRIAEHLHVVKGPAGNTLVAVDSDGLILIEGVPAQYAQEYLGFVREFTGEDTIKTLVNTHWHPESAGLNAALAPTATEVISHFNTRQWLGATIYERGEPLPHEPVAEPYLPETTFRDTHSIDFRGGSIELGYMLQAHTDGDIYAWFPQQDVLFTGPVIRQDAWAVVDETTNGFIGGMMDALEQLGSIAGDATVIVPAGGDVMNKAAFTELTAMYQGLKEEMVALLRESRSAEEVVLANPAAGLKPEWGDASAFLDEGFRSFYGHLRNTRHVGVMP